MHGAKILTESDINYMIENFSKYTNKEFAKKFNCHIATIRKEFHSRKMFRINLEYWTREQIDFLCKNYKKVGDKELAILFNANPDWYKKKGWTFKHIEKKRLYLSLHRTPGQIRKIKDRNINRGCWKNTSTWQTRGEFPDGTIRIWEQNQFSNTSYFKVIKVDGTYYHYGRWLYEKHFGPIPKGSCIGYKDGDNMNITVENIEKITRAEHAIRNRKIKKYPEDLQQLIKTLKQLNQQLNQQL